jgi:hypothetical protein
MRVTLALAALLLVGLAGCDRSGPAASPAPGAPGVEAVGAPSAAPAPEAPAPAPAPALPEGNPAPAYPTTARAYSEAAIAAWADGNLATLGNLTTAQVQEQLIEIPQLNPAWDYQTCDGTAGAHYCAFRNADGDVITLKVVNQYLGQAHAINQVTAGLTTYAADGEQYVRRFVAAWGASNTPRMQALAKASVVASVSKHKRPAVGAPVALTSKSGGAGLMIVTVKVESTTFRLHVGTTLLGQKHAIVGYEAVPLSLTS